MSFRCRLLGHKVYDSQGNRVPTPKDQLRSFIATVKTSEGGYVCKRCKLEVHWFHYTWKELKDNE